MILEENLLSTIIFNLYRIIRFLLPIAATYLITRYSTNRPKRIAIKEKQFHNVYLPLYRFLCVANESDLIKCHRKLYSVLNRYYELPFPQLHQLVTSFSNSLNKSENDEKSLDILNQIRHQISIDYELLRRDLGYPTQNIFSIFKRMAVKDKIRFLYMKLTSPLLIIFSFSVILTAAFKNPFMFFIALISGCLFVTLLILGFKLSIDK